MEGVMKGFPENNRFPPVGASYHFVDIPKSSTIVRVTDPGPQRKKSGSVGVGGSGIGNRLIVALPDTLPRQFTFATESNV